MSKSVELHLDYLDGLGHKVEALRCDNAGEHVELKNICNKRGIRLEYTAPYTPQQNGVIEKRIADDQRSCMAMLTSARLTNKYKRYLRAEAKTTATKMRNIWITKDKDKCPFETFYQKDSPLKPEHLVQWGRLGFVTDRTKIKAKTKPRGFPAIMVGYAENHPSDCYRMFNPATNRVFISRDVTWSDWTSPAPETVIAQLREKDSTLDLTPGIELDAPVTLPNPQGPHLIPDEPGCSVAGRNERRFQSQITTTGRNANSSEPKDSLTATIDLREDDDEYEDDDENEDDENDATIQNLYRQTPEQETRTSAFEQRQTRSQGPPSDPEEIPRSREAQNLRASFNPIPDEIEQEQQEHHNLVMTATMSDPGEPRTIQEALSSDDAKEWEESIKGEIMNFLNRKAWTQVPMSQVMSEGRKPVGTKTVFKIKDEHDGTKRRKTRIVTQGFSMIPGKDYTESFSPVAMDISIRTCIALSLYYMTKKDQPNVKTRTRKHVKGKAKARILEKNRWTMEVFDVEAAFLNADPGTKMYIKIPEAMVMVGMVSREEADSSAYLLEKSMYGNVDAALRFYMKFKTILVKHIGLIQSKADPCIFFSQHADGSLRLLLGTHVDDTLICGQKDDIDHFLNQFEKHLKIDRLGPLTKHLGVWWNLVPQDDGTIHAVGTMEKMRMAIIAQFEEVTGTSAPNFPTPGYPGVVLSRTTEEEEVVMGPEFRSLLGKLMYYQTKLLPCLANAVRELASHMSNPNKEHWKSMARCVGWMKHYEGELKLVMRTPESLNAIGISDANNAQDPESRKSISGGIQTIGGALVGFGSKKQPVVALSSCESELISYTDNCKSIRFIQILVEELTSTHHIGLVFEDNAGCIFLVKNEKTGARTKHIDVRYFYGRELFFSEPPKVIPYFVKSEENLADGLTKNQPEKLFTLHSGIMMNGTIMYRREDVKTAIAMRASNDRLSVYGIPDGKQDDKRSVGKERSKEGEYNVENHVGHVTFGLGQNCISNSEERNSEDILPTSWSFTE